MALGSWSLPTTKSLLFGGGDEDAANEGEGLRNNILSGFRKTSTQAIPAALAESQSCEACL